LAIAVENVSVFLLFFSKDPMKLLWKPIIMQEFINSRDRLSEFRSLVRQWTPVKGKGICVLLFVFANGDY
jgi:hypothetical protein